MAEQSRAKRAEEVHLSEDDPLAELANIMGMTDEEQLGVGLEEIELELERELLGDVGEETAPDERPEETSAQETPDKHDQAARPDASMDEDLTDELVDALSGIDDGDAAFEEPLSDDLADGLETGAASGGEPEDSGEEAGSVLDEIFAEHGETEDQAGTLSSEEESGETELTAGGGAQSGGRAVDPYAFEYRASLSDSEDETGKADEAGEPLASAELHDALAEEQPSAAGDEDGEEQTRTYEATGAGDGNAEEGLAPADASQEPGESRADDAHEVAFDELDDEFTNALDDGAGMHSAEADDEGAMAPERSAAQEAEPVAFDQLDAQDIPFGDVHTDEESTGDRAIQPEETASEPEATDARADSDMVPEEPGTVFGEADLGTDEPVPGFSEDADAMQMAGSEGSPQEEESEASDNGPGEQFEQRMAALFGNARSRPLAEPAIDDGQNAHWPDEDETLYGADRQSAQGPDEDEAPYGADRQSAAAGEFADSEEIAGSAYDDFEPGLDEEPAGEQSAAMTAGERGADPNLDALAALERAVAELSGLDKLPQTGKAAEDNAAPDVETIAIEEPVPAVHDDLGIPDIPEPEKPVRPLVFDDLESEISAGFDGPPSTAGQEERDQGGSEDDDLLKEFDAIFEEGLTVEGGPEADESGFEQAGSGEVAAAAAAGSAAAQYDRWAGDGDAAPVQDDEKRPVRGPLIAALVGGIALIGAIGVFAYFSGGSGMNGGQVVVKADNEPVKVKPANPGGKTVPNQDNKVYQKVAGEKADTAPEQKTLVSTEEEPVDIAKPAPAAQAPAENSGSAPSGETADNGSTTARPESGQDSASSGMNAGTNDNSGTKDEIQQAIEAAKKSDDRLLPGVEPVETPTAAPDDVAVLTPRRVRTMIVKPDGTLVERQETGPVASQAETPAPDNSGQSASSAAAGADQPAETVTPDTARELDAAAKKLAETTTPAESAGAQAGSAARSDQGAAGSADTSYPVTPERAPIIPSRPADQPVNVVGSTKDGGEATAAAAPSAAPAGEQIASTATLSGYSVQIASQPSPEAAQRTSINLARRYETVLGSRRIVVIPAEISGRGTYYRVRVEAQSLADANDLCTRYKAAGGDCFVARPQ